MLTKRHVLRLCLCATLSSFLARYALHAFYPKRTNQLQYYKITMSISCSAGLSALRKLFIQRHLSSISSTKENVLKIISLLTASINPEHADSGHGRTSCITILIFISIFPPV